MTDSQASQDSVNISSRSQRQRTRCIGCGREFISLNGHLARGPCAGLRAQQSTSHHSATGQGSQAQTEHQGDPSPHNVPEYIQERFVRGFGAPLLNCEGGGNNSEWEERWRRTMTLQGKQYSLPDGAVGRRFVSQLANEIQGVANGSANSERIFIFCAALLQRDRPVKTGPDVRRLLERRMDLWQEQKFDELVSEAVRCDRKLKVSRQAYNQEHKVRVFTRLVLAGRLRDATRWITDRGGGGVLAPEAVLGNGRTVLDVLQDKHPSQMVPDPRTFMNCDELPTLVDVDISESHIATSAHRLHGAAGPSGTDAEQWSKMLLRYGTHSSRLREAAAALTRSMANGIVEWARIRALLARRGIALDKQPGVRPIGVGEVLQRLCAKTMAMITGYDLQEECGADQLGAGIKAGVEGAVHAVKKMFEESDDVALLLVDAANAFNALSRPLALWNSRILWPRCARFLFNTYRGYPQTLFRHSEFIMLSREGTTQGDPLGMMMYAVGTLPLIRSLKGLTCKQNWYADDSACIGKLEEIRQWMSQLENEGPKWGYHPEPRKCFLIIRPGMEEEAAQLFPDVQVAYSQRFLGGFIGPLQAKRDYVKGKVKDWTTSVTKMAAAADKSPQAVHTAFTKSLQREWAYVHRVIEGCDEEYIPLRDVIQQVLIPAILGRTVSPTLHELLQLPARLGGLAIENPVTTAAEAHPLSERAASKLVDAIRQGTILQLNDHEVQVSQVLRETRTRRRHAQEAKSEDLMERLPPRQKRVLRRTRGVSQWLTMVPLAADDYDLSSTQFRDALSIRYGWEPQNLPASCDGCNEAFNLNHALNCKRGGQVKRGHDNVRDACGHLAGLAWGRVAAEPILRESDENGPALVADLMVHGVWHRERPAFFDNRVINADAASYANLEWPIIAQNAAVSKHTKYDRAAEDLRGSFTPLVCACDGSLHKEFERFLKHLASTLSGKWQKPYSQVAAWVKGKVQFAIIRAVALRLRGTRRQIRCLGLEDGAGLHFIEED